MVLLFPHLTGDAENFQSLYFILLSNRHIGKTGLRIKSLSIETMEINKCDFGIKGLRFVQKSSMIILI